MLDSINVHLRQPGQPVAHDPRRSVGLLQFVGDRPEHVPQVGEAVGVHPGRGAHPPVHQPHAVDVAALAPLAAGPGLAEAVADPRPAVRGAEHQIVVGTLGQDDAQGVDRLRPQGTRPVDRLAVAHLRPGEPDESPVKVDRRPGQGRAVLCSVGAIDAQHDHRAKLAGRRGDDGADLLRRRGGAGLVVRRRLPEHRPELGFTFDPVVRVGVIPDRPHTLDGSGEGVLAQARADQVPVQASEVGRGQVVDQRVRAKVAAHQRCRVAVVLQRPVAQGAGVAVLCALGGVPVADLADGRRAGGWGRRIGLAAGVDCPGPTVELGQGLVRVPVGDVELTALVVLPPAAADVGGERVARVGLDGLRHASSLTGLLCIGHQIRCAPAQDDRIYGGFQGAGQGFISPGSCVRVAPLPLRQVTPETALTSSAARPPSQDVPPHYPLDNADFGTGQLCAHNRGAVPHA